MPGWLWIVDPLTRTLEVYRLEDGRWIVAASHAGGEKVQAAPFDAVEVEMQRWWGEDQRPTRRASLVELMV